MESIASQAVREIISAAKANGYSIRGIESDQFVKFESVNQAISEICDNSIAYLILDNGESSPYVMFVPGNDEAMDIVSDWSMSINSWVSPLVMSW